MPSTAHELQPGVTAQRGPPSTPSQPCSPTHLRKPWCLSSTETEGIQAENAGKCLFGRCWQAGTAPPQAPAAPALQAELPWVAVCAPGKEKPPKAPSPRTWRRSHKAPGTPWHHKNNPHGTSDPHQPQRWSSTFHGAGTGGWSRRKLARSEGLPHLPPTNTLGCFVPMVFIKQSHLTIHPLPTSAAQRSRRTRSP